MRFAEAILRWRKYVILLNERFHSREDQFFEDPIKVRQQRNRPIVVYVSVIFGLIFAIFSLVGYIPVEIERFIISASVPLITFHEYFNS